MNTFDDELDDVNPTPPKPTVAAAAAAKPIASDGEEATVAPKAIAGAAKAANPVPASAGAAADDEDLDADFGDEKIMARPDALNRCRPEKGKAVRFAVLPFLVPKKAKTHFVEIPNGKTGTYRCLSKINSDEPEFCCKKTGKDGDLHVVALVVRYTNADSKSGKMEKGQPIQWEIEYVDLSRANYRKVSKLPEEEQTVYDIDIVMTHADRAFGYEFEKIASKARWKANPEFAAEVEAAAQKFVRDGGKKLISRLGRKLNPVEWKALLSGMSTTADEAKMDDMDDL